MSTTPKIIGLTGNIGSGKSTVAALFAQYGWPVFDSDKAARFATLKNTSAFETIVKHFGENIIDATGEIDRKQLATLVFNQPEKIAVLNGIVHPAVKDIFDRWQREQTSPYVVRETALLFETGIYKTSFKNVVVTCPLETRIARVMQRNHISREQVLEREKNQWEESEKIKSSDFVLRNFNEALLPQFSTLIQQLEAAL